jgi:hypothetical protein
MLRLNTSTGRFEQVEETALKDKQLLERYDLQKAIVSSWEVFKNEIGLPSAFLVGQEINPDTSTQNTLDLLAYDGDTSSLIVIELKRDRNKLQLLQALSYAAMVSRWNAEVIISKVQRDISTDHEELIDLISSSSFSGEVRVVLVAESFDPEVIITSNWLSTKYDVNIAAFAVGLHEIESQLFITVDQRFPLRELDEAYESRGRSRSASRVTPNIDWDEIIPTLKYPFAEKGVRLCQKIRDGEPDRRRFGMLRKHFDGFDWITLNFRRNYVNVYLRGQFEGDRELLEKKFTSTVEIGSWRDGLSIKIETAAQFEELVKWLKLDAK